jgi:hypothetical protein
MPSVVLQNDPWKAKISVKLPVVFSSVRIEGTIGMMALRFMVIWSDHHQAAIPAKARLSLTTFRPQHRPA